MANYDNAPFEIHVHGDVPLRADVTYAQLQEALRPLWKYAGAKSLADGATAYTKTMDRCDGIASPDIRGNPEFRRLVDGARSGLGFIPKAIETRDTNLLQRVLSELRSFDNLLAFRFG